MPLVELMAWMRILHMALEIVFPFEALARKLAVRVGAKMRPLETVFGLSMTWKQ